MNYDHRQRTHMLADSHGDMVRVWSWNTRQGPAAGIAAVIRRMAAEGMSLIDLAAELDGGSAHG